MTMIMISITMKKSSYRDFSILKILFVFSEAKVFKAKWKPFVKISRNA